VEAAIELISLRTQRRFDEAREYSRLLWGGVGDRAAAITAAVRKQYAQLFAVMPTPAYITYGNVDIPPLWPDYAREEVHVLDGQVVELGNRRFGFVGGGLQTPMHTPYEVSDEDYAAKVAAIGSVDVLCCHIPPDVPELLYDTQARRLERGSAAVLAAIKETQPDVVLFGHVHNPLSQRTRIGRTECINVGHFRGRGTPYVLTW
jgi:Icc-related predicted phosphoesterase